MSCKEIEGNYYIHDDTSIKCYTKQHMLFYNYLCIPLIILMVAILPIIILSLIYRNRERFDYIKVRFQLGYLTIGYNSQKKFSIYWDFMHMLKKISSIFLLSYLS